MRFGITNLSFVCVFFMQDGATPLFKAAHKGFSAVVNELLKYRPNLGLLPVRTHENIPRRMGGSMKLNSDRIKPNFHFASAVIISLHRPHSGRISISTIHVLNLFFNFLFQNGETPIHAAAMFGHLPVVKQLIAAGSDISWKNRDQLTPLQVARQQNYTSVTDYLEERRAIGTKYSNHRYS